MVDARRVAVRRKLVLAVGTVTRSVGASGEVVVGSGESSSEEGRDGHAARRPDARARSLAPWGGSVGPWYDCTVSTVSRTER